MIINAAYEGPPYSPSIPPGVAGCASCLRSSKSLNGTSPIAGLSYATVGTLVLTALAVAAVGITLYSFNGSKKNSLAGRNRRRRR